MLTSELEVQVEYMLNYAYHSGASALRGSTCVRCHLS